MRVKHGLVTAAFCIAGTSALLALAIIAVGLLIVPVQRTVASPARGQDQTIHVGVPLVNIYATVVDNRNACVPDLDQSDFKIFEDKVEQKVAFFSREKTLPLSIGLLIDTSGSVKDRISAEQKAAAQFLHGVLQKGDKAFIMTFDVDSVLLANWTSDLPTLDDAVDRIQAGIGVPKSGPIPQYRGGTLLYDTIYAAAAKKMTDQGRRKALIILTDADDDGSEKKITDAIEAAQRADTVVQVLLVRDKTGLAFFDVAKRLAGDTGGRAIEVANPKNLQSAFDQISDELHSEYSIGYYPTNSNPDGKYRQLKGELTNKKYKVSARKGYYARTAGN
jgi:VWFA-related protein